MKLLDKLEFKLSKFAMNNLVYYLLAGQAILFLANYVNPTIIEKVLLRMDFVLNGEWWRLFTFVFYPSDLNPVFFAFFLYFQFFVGETLKNKWGVFKFQLYFLIIYLATIAISFIDISSTLSGAYIFFSISLAFYYLFPEVIFRIFFIIPVKAKWIGRVTWVVLILGFISGSIIEKVLIILSISNFLLFFGKDLWLEFKLILRNQNNLLKKENNSTLRCTLCKQTDKIFYSCKECKPSAYYCEDCINIHKHKILH